METNKETTKQDGPVEESKGIISNIQVSCCAEEDFKGEKEYRSVFAVGELKQLYIDTEIFNCGYNETNSTCTVTIRLFRKENEDAVCIAEKSGELTLDINDLQIQYEEILTQEDLVDHVWKEGVYRFLVDINGKAMQSDDIFIIPGEGHADEYFRVLHAGLDRIDEGESEEMDKNRPHSFSVVDKKGLQGIRFLLVAQNLLGKKWVYEFVIRVVGKNGILKSVQKAKAAQFMNDQAGNSLLCFGVVLNPENGFTDEGEYQVYVSFMDELILTLPFAIGQKNIPYDFEKELSGQLSRVSEKPQQSVPYSEKSRDEIMDRLYRLVGLRKVKEEITRIIEYAEFLRLRREHGFSDHYTPMHLIFTGHPGTGKNTVAEMIGELYCVMGFLSDGKVHHFSRTDLVQEGMDAEEQLVRRAIQQSLGGVMFIDNVGELFCPDNREDKGVVVLGMLFTILLQERPEVLVIMADNEEEMNLLLESLPELKKLFPKHLCFEDYSPEELMEITRKKLSKMQYRFAPDAEDKFYKQLQMVCIANELDFTNGKYIDEQIEDAARNMSRRLMSKHLDKYKKEDLMMIEAEDIVPLQTGDPNKPMEKLNAMVGLRKLKQTIAQHLNYVYFIRERQKHGFTDILPSLNMILSGNPGTGKTTVLKMMGEIYHASGILNRPNVLVQDARALLAENGMNAQQIAELLMNTAQGGILYINQADSLSQTEFGLSVLEEILTYLSVDECGETIVALGGYPDRMKQMLEMNPTLIQYFPCIFQFTDYTPEELMRIAENKLKEKNYSFHPKAKEVFAELIQKAYDNRNKNFGNVLLVEKIVEVAIRNMSDRTMSIRKKRELTRQELTTIRKEDVSADLFDLPKFDKDSFDEKEIRQALNDLDQLVGQENMKKQIKDFVELARHYNREGMKLSSKMSLQWCFTGNSAMGKGSVARIIARIYKAMGIIPTGNVFTFKVEKLLGLTEEEALRCIGEALIRSEGGILLFDEDSPRLSKISAFHERVRAMLMSQMASRPGSHLLIYAGPRNQVANLNSDAEQMSEVVNVLVFEDYTHEELMVILKRCLQKENMKMTDMTRKYMNNFIDCLISTEERRHASSRLMRIVADLIVRNCLQRIAKSNRKRNTSDLITVYKQDVSMFTEDFVSGVMKERKRIGFV